MKLTNKNIYWIIAGGINLFTALIHAFAGQIDLVDPLLESNLSIQIKTQWLGAWHMVTAVLIASSYYLIKNGWSNSSEKNSNVVHFIGILYLLFGTAFILSSMHMNVFASQWILLLPIGLLALIRKPAYAN